MSDPTALLQTAEWLFSNGIPFSFHITARYLDATAITTTESRGCSTTHAAPYDHAIR